MSNIIKKKFEKNLISFLKLFQNRPFHLAKYLLENNGLSDEFIDKITKSEKLNFLSENLGIDELPDLNFKNFKEMMKFFENIDNEYNSEYKNKEQLTSELNKKMDFYIQSDRFEEAIKLRDYMIRNHIKRKSEKL